jgi:Flp pilus assembly protein CpaB
MSRRARAFAFLLLALLAATAAATIADGYGASVTRGFGPLRPVVVLEAKLPAGKPIGPVQIAEALAIRRVPERFVPPDALVDPAEALGLLATTVLPVGSYLQATQLSAPRSGGGNTRALARDRRPVEITVSGAGALLAAGPAPRSAKVDVVVTSEPGGPGPGRTYVAAAGVPLLALRPEAEGAGGVAAATLGLTRRQALRLIAAESFARKVTVLPGA